MISRVCAAALALSSFIASASARAVGAEERVYVGRLRASGDVEASLITTVEEAILVAAKKARPDLTVLGRSDVGTLLDVDAERQAAGCDTDSCAAEVADALAAKQIVTGQLSRVGSTWILSLTRLERASLTVLARDQVQAGSDSELVPTVRGLVGAVLAEPKAPTAPVDPTPWLLIGGGAVAGAGVIAAVAGGGMLAWSTDYFRQAQEAQDVGDTQKASASRAVGEPLYLAGWAALGGGALAALVGGGVAAAALVE